MPSYASFSGFRRNTLDGHVVQYDKICHFQVAQLVKPTSKCHLSGSTIEKHQNRKNPAGIQMLRNVTHEGLAATRRAIGEERQAPRGFQKQPADALGRSRAHLQIDRYRTGL